MNKTQQKFYLSNKDLTDFLRLREIKAKLPRKNSKSNLVISMVDQYFIVKPPIDDMFEVEHFSKI